MKKWKIVYQKGNDILVTEIEANTIIEAERQFYMGDLYADIITIEEVIT